MKHKILVTGGAGFIGSHIVDTYINEGHDVSILDNFSTGSQSNINKKSKVYNGDIRDLEFVKFVINDFNPDIVNHHAAQIYVDRSIEDPVFDNRVNVEGLINLLESCKSKVSQLIFASSGGAVYGDQTEPSTETTIPNPISPYGISKLTGENYIKFYHQKYSLNYKILRYSNVYGLRQNLGGEAGVIVKFFEQFKKGIQPIIYGDGTNTRDFIYVQDVANANLLALENDKNDIWNISSNVETSVNDLYDKIAFLLKNNQKKIYQNAKSGDVKKSILDNTKALKELNWKPSFTLDSGLEVISREL